MKKLDEYKLSAPLNIWQPLIYKNKQEIIVDVYYTINGYPKEIHDEYGANEVNSFRFDLVEEIKRINNCNDIWRILGDAFAIPYKKENVKDFVFEYKCIKYTIKKRTIKLQVLEL